MQSRRIRRCRKALAFETNAARAASGAGRFERGLLLCARCTRLRSSGHTEESCVNPFQYLGNEHRELTRVLDVLDHLVRTVAAGGSIDRLELDALVDYFREV